MPDEGMNRIISGFEMSTESNWENDVMKSVFVSFEGKRQIAEAVYMNTTQTDEAQITKVSDAALMHAYIQS